MAITKAVLTYDQTQKTVAEKKAIAVSVGLPKVGALQSVGSVSVTEPDGKQITEYFLEDNSTVKINEKNEVVA